MNKRFVMVSALLSLSLLALSFTGCAKPLALSLWEPQHEATFADSLIEVRGYVSDSKATVWVNDSIVTVSNRGYFSAQLELAEGENIIKVTAARGKTGKWKDVIERVVSVTHEPEKTLALDLSFPQDGAEVTESVVMLGGMVSDPAAKVVVRDIEAEVAADGSFTANIELAEGKNVIEVTATAEGVKPVIKAITVIYTAPTPETQARNLAEQFVRNSPTFVFDGIEESLKLVETLYPGGENTWTFVFYFESRHAGYGDRSGQALAQVITPHEAVITIEQNEIKSAVMDEKWDMLTQQIVEEK